MLGAVLDFLANHEADLVNAAFALDADDSAPRLFLDAVFVLETLAPSSLHADRFLPPTPIRVDERAPTRLRSSIKSSAAPTTSGPAKVVSQPSIARLLRN